FLELGDSRAYAEDFVGIDGSAMENAPTRCQALNRKMQMGAIGRGVAARPDKPYNLPLPDVVAGVQIVGVILQVRIVVDELASRVEFINGISAKAAQEQTGDRSILNCVNRSVAWCHHIRCVMLLIAAHRIEGSLKRFRIDSIEGNLEVPA